jgi:hypothetical protein
VRTFRVIQEARDAFHVRVEPQAGATDVRGDVRRALEGAVLASGVAVRVQLVPTPRAEGGRKFRGYLALESAANGRP